ncbi:relaxase/mobilization nuclease domain-containing protein [Sphingobacterium arenae]|uniref:Relaxase/mobilization nuclease domain-containing protein n=1 Tax=Sphingobacterium arenae TaxID=1280598 RepID=A0ABR7XYF8_9SPHI|nr:relaxase/mobilization nuclease domain-containing protein [Sphingobacterium arenae]MBD1424049.1 relaxase/mobilization nuclease domain-containing protein [Sphingobacterium arenae]
MIVKILEKSATFGGVRYNTDKVDKDKGELIKVSGFGALQALQHLRPADYVNYLEAQSAASSRTKYPQLHAVISCKGQSHSKEELTTIAEKWLDGMGYGGQPYLLVFHKDTANNHIHMVTTRVDKNGKKINDSYEKLRAYEVLNRIMGLDEKQQADKDIEKALAYSFYTRAQFMMILEAQGYNLKLSDGNYLVSRYGKQQGVVPLEKVDARIGLFNRDINRLAQLRAIFAKYRNQYDLAAVPISAPHPGGKTVAFSGYTSGMAQMLSEKFGVQVIFHGKDGKPPYGYTLIDHSRKMVYKGKDLMPLAEFIGPPDDTPEISLETEGTDPTTQGQTHPSEKTVPDAGHTYSTTQWAPGIQIDISDDIDDEAIHGRNRRRKRKARTNTR